MAVRRRIRSIINCRIWTPLSIVIIVIETVFLLMGDDNCQQFITGDSRTERPKPQVEYIPYRTSSSIYDLQGCECGLHFKVDQDQALAFPVPQLTSKQFLVIGIPTVTRSNGSYVIETVKSLLVNMNEKQRQDVLLVIMAADLEWKNRQFVLNRLQVNFEEEIKAGYIHVITAPMALYTNLKVTKLTYEETPQHVYWRSKQNFDYTFLMRYSASLAQYYLQLEDDVYTVENYISKINQSIEERANRNDTWVCLEFSELGFIGKLYRTEDLERLTQVMLLFYEEEPVDYNYNFFNSMMVQETRIIVVPTLFQHKGYYSSLKGKKQAFKDRFFNVSFKTLHGDNPPAIAYCSMRHVHNFDAQTVYSSSGIFWSSAPPTPFDRFIIAFEKPQRVQRIVIITGWPNGKEKLQSASVDVGHKRSGRKKPPGCQNPRNIGRLNNGTLDISNVSSKVDFNVECITLTKMSVQRLPVIIREIAIFVEGQDESESKKETLK